MRSKLFISGYFGLGPMIQMSVRPMAEARGFEVVSTWHQQARGPELADLEAIRARWSPAMHDDTLLDALTVPEARQTMRDMLEDLDAVLQELGAAKRSDALLAAADALHGKGGSDG